MYVCVHALRIISHTRLASQNKYISWPAVETGSVTFTRRSEALSPVAAHPCGIMGVGEFAYVCVTLSVRGGFFICVLGQPSRRVIIKS